MNTFAGLTSRQRQILMFVIDDYIQRGEAVASSSVSRSGVVDVSSATVRNVMCDLEEQGFLVQPHRSAGRVPTALSMREYFDFLSNSPNALEDLAVQLPIQFDDQSQDFESLSRQAGSILSQISRMAGVVIGPQISSIRMRELKLVMLEPTRILAILLTSDGIRMERVCVLDTDVEASTLQRMQNYLNELVSGKTLQEVRLLLRSAIGSAREDYQSLALQLGVQLAADQVTSIHVEGLLNLLAVDEFASDVMRLQDLSKTIDERERLLELVDRMWDSRTPVAVIGPELGGVLGEDLGLVVCGYYQGDKTIGMVGVLGPMRMDYARMIPLVDRVASVLSN